MIVQTATGATGKEDTVIVDIMFIAIINHLTMCCRKLVYQD